MKWLFYSLLALGGVLHLTLGGCVAIISCPVRWDTDRTVQVDAALWALWARQVSHERQTIDVVMSVSVVVGFQQSLIVLYSD